MRPIVKKDLDIVPGNALEKLMGFRSAVVKWGAVLALALLAVAAAPHLHDETESVGDGCVLCPVHDTPFTAASVAQELPELEAAPADCSFGTVHARDEALRGRCPRAPPA